MRPYHPKVASGSVFTFFTDLNVMRVGKITLSTGVVSADREFFYYG